ncbi:MAG: hypothetical protein KAT05_17815 [Spirochaetes bacterium]|nr:hypothetical protein [Spirochaetota bacterium]
MAKSRRSNYLIDKPFQLGFISRYVIIIIITIIAAFLATFCYYWIDSYIGKFKLNQSVIYMRRGHLTFQGKKIYDYSKEKIKVYEDIDEFDNKVFKCYQSFDVSTTRYETGDIVLNVAEADLKPEIGSIKIPTSRFKMIFFPLLWTGVALIIIISIFSLFFSHRMAGPIYRMRVSLDRMLAGDNDFKVRIRKNDFFVNIVDRLEQLRQKMK